MEGKKSSSEPVEFKEPEPQDVFAPVFVPRVSDKFDVEMLDQITFLTQAEINKCLKNDKYRLTEIAFRLREGPHEFQVKMSEEYILNMIVTDEPDKVKKSFKAGKLLEEKHKDGPFYWSKETFETIRAIFRRGCLTYIYHGTGMHVLVMMDEKKDFLGLLRQHKVPFYEGDNPPDLKSMKTIREPWVFEDLVIANEEFVARHILDPCLGDSDYELWSWKTWGTHVLNRGVTQPIPYRRQGGKAQSGEPIKWQHTIIIGMKELINIASTEKGAEGFWKNLPLKVYTVTMFGKEVTSVHCHPKAYICYRKYGGKTREADYRLLGYASTLFGNYVQTTELDPTLEHGRPRKFHYFMIKHVLDPKSWEADYDQYGHGAWNALNWNAFYDIRRQKLRQAYSFEVAKTIILATEKEIIETFRGQTQHTNRRGEFNFAWSRNCHFVAIMSIGDSSKQISSYYSARTRKCPPFYIHAALQTFEGLSLPVHLSGVSYTQSVEAAALSDIKKRCLGTEYQFPDFAKADTTKVDCGGEVLYDINGELLKKHPLVIEKDTEKWSNRQNVRGRAGSSAVAGQSGGSGQSGGAGQSGGTGQSGIAGQSGTSSQPFSWGARVKAAPTPQGPPTSKPLPATAKRNLQPTQPAPAPALRNQQDVSGAAAQAAPRSTAAPPATSYWSRQPGPPPAGPQTNNTFNSNTGTRPSLPSGPATAAPNTSARPQLNYRSAAQNVNPQQGPRQQGPRPQGSGPQGQGMQSLGKTVQHRRRDQK